MHCHCSTNNRAPRWTFTDPCEPEVRPGAREESASPAWLATPAMNARDTTKVYIWRPDTGCGPTLYRKCHSHSTPGKRHNNTWVEPHTDVQNPISAFKDFITCSSSNTELHCTTGMCFVADSSAPDLKYEKKRTVTIWGVRHEHCHPQHINRTTNQHKDGSRKSDQILVTGANGLIAVSTNSNSNLTSVVNFSRTTAFFCTFLEFVNL